MKCEYKIGWWCEYYGRRCDPYGCDIKSQDDDFEMLMVKNKTTLDLLSK